MNPKKIIFSLLVVALFFSSFIFGANKAHAATSITTCLELQDMSLDLSADYVLANDIDCSDTINWNGGEGFIPVGNFVTPFTGTLDGQGFVISDLYEHTTSGDDSGLFGNASTGFQVIDLGMEDVSIYGDAENIGSIAGFIEDPTSVIANSYATGNVESGNMSASNAGGLVGQNYGDVTDSHFIGNVTAAGDGYMGGLVGFSYGGHGGHDITTDNNYFTGNINMTDTDGYAGGLFGYAYKTFVTNSHSDGGTINTEESSYVGGLIGYQSEVTTENSYSELNIIGTGDTVGGLIGHVDNNDHVSDSYATGNVTNDLGSYIGGLIGESAVDIIDSYATGNVMGGDNSYVGGLIGYVYAGNIDNTYFTGSVSGLDGGYVGGLIGYDSDGSISDSHADGGSVIAGAGTYSGGLVGYSSVSISNSYSEQNVTSDDGYVGGLVGYIDSGAISDSYASGDVTGSADYIGGLIGLDFSDEVSDSYATGDVFGVVDAGYIGGFIGSHDSNLSPISNSYSTGNVVNNGGDSYTGGFIGYNGRNGGSMISQSYSTGNVTSQTDSVGGFIGYNQGTVEKSYSIGDVDGPEKVGGFVGENIGTITNSYSQGNVTNSGDYSGGFAALNNGINGTYPGIIDKAYAIGTIIGTTNLGGFAGAIDGTALTTNSFWDTENSGMVASPGGGTGKTTLEMQDEDTYTNLTTPGLSSAWDFGSIWDICPPLKNGGYPYLQWQTFGSFPPCGSTTFPPDDPSLLGPADHVDGSSASNHQPTLTFTTSDPDGGDTVQYQILVDDTSNFSSPLVDYTSALGAPGASTFTVGQAVGGGSYAVGSAGQSLGDGSYYWEVKAIDNHASASAFSIANSGAVAFITTTGGAPVSHGGGGGGGSSSVTVDIKVNGLDGPLSLPYPESYTYSWTSHNASSCEVTSPFSSGVAASGESTFIAFGHPLYRAPGNSITFTINCTDGNSVASDSAVINFEMPTASIGTSALVATNIVCDNESDLPNWNGGHETITSATATNFLSSHPACHVEPSSKFQVRPWGVVNNPSFIFNWSTSPDNPLNTPNPGATFAGEAPSPWITLPTVTDASGNLTYTFNTYNLWHLYIREVLKEEYAPFSGNPVTPPGNNEASEFYCNRNILDYGNFSRLDAPFLNEQTFYCVSFNAPKSDVVSPPLPPTPPIPPSTPPLYQTPASYQYPTPATYSTPSGEVTPPTPPTGEVPFVPTTEYATPAGPETLPAGITEKIKGGLVATVVDTKIFFSDPRVVIFNKLAASLSFLTSLALVAKPITSGVSPLNVLSYIFIFIPQLLRFKRSPRPWGSVYDSQTKRPLPYSRVEILNNESRKLESVITDEQGRYGFLVASQFSENGDQKIALVAKQKDYVFPSKMETSSNERILYPNTYKGELVAASGDTTNFDIPMDPISAVPNLAKAPYFGLVSAGFNNFLTHLSKLLFVLGMIFGVLSYVFHPSGLNLLILAIILLTGLLRLSGFKLKSFGMTKDKSTNKVMPFGLIALHNLAGKRINFTVSDALGRYFLLSPKGRFNLRAYTPSHISPMRETDIPLISRKGWVSKEIDL